MIGFFPTLYPGELLYSAIARYQIRSGNTSPKSNIEELFNSRSITATADLPCGLDNLVQNLPSYSSVTVDSLIQNHTLYPFYAPFLPPKRAKQVQESMKRSKGGNIHTRAGVMASSIFMPQFFRFCPECLGLKGLFDKHLDKLHETRAYLELVTETVEDFQIRRIDWTIAILEDRGEEIKEWKILRLAALSKDLSDKVRIKLEQDLN